MASLTLRIAPATVALAAAVLLASPTVAGAQARAIPADHAGVRQAVEMLRADNAWTLEQQVAVCEIPAPPFMEQRRAEDYVQRLRAAGIDSVRIDTEGNVIGERPGTGDGPLVVISAHLDTVFPEETDVTVRMEGDVMHGPGIGDDCRGLAVVLAVARAMNEHNVQTEGTILFVGTVGEEGPGNLRGVRHLFETELAGQVDYFISVDGTGLNITHAAVGSHRYRVTYSGPGGHSYGAFGMPNPIHAVGRAIAKFAELQVPREPRTTFSVGVIQGGTSVNSIAFEASFDVDMRSEQREPLDAMDARFRELVQEALEEERARWPNSQRGLEVTIDTIGIRPAGAQPEDAPIVLTAINAGAALGFEPRLGPSSTDSNIPISLGIPAITIDGGGQGRGAHALDEMYRDGPEGWKGPQWALLIVAALAGV